jgi:hypothetical protein
MNKMNGVLATRITEVWEKFKRPDMKTLPEQNL